MRFCNLAHEKLSSNHYFFSSQWSFFLPISNLELKPFSMQKSMVFYWWVTPSWAIFVWVNFNCHWLKGAYDPLLHSKRFRRLCVYRSWQLRLMTHSFSTNRNSSLPREGGILIGPYQKDKTYLFDKLSPDWSSQRK